MPPTQLLQTLDQVRRRARWLSIAYGVGLVAAAAVGLLLATVLVDYVLNLPAVPRVIVMLGALGTTLYLAYQYVARPAVAQVSRNDIAGRLERAFPQFDDRLRSTVDFLDGQNPGSGVLQQRVIEQASALAGEVNLADAVVSRPAVVSVSSAAGAFVLLLVLAFGIVNHHTLAIITSRLLTPFNAEPWPKRVKIDVTSTLPTRVPVGQKIDIQMKLDRGDKPTLKPILYYQVDGGPVQQMFMGRGDDGHFASSLDARLDPATASGTLKVWIEAGDDKRELQPITIVPRLTIRQISAAVTPPAYVPNRRASTLDLSTSPLVTAEGSSIAMTVPFNKPLGAANPEIEPLGANAKPPAATWTRPDAQTAVATFDATASTRFRLRATDSDGFSNSALEEYELVVKPDTNLSVQLESPRRSDERTPQAYVPLQAVIEDDCGAEWAKLVVNRLQPSPKTWEIPLLTDAKPQDKVGWQPIDSTPDRVRFRLSDRWELSQLQLTPGDVIEYAVVARDNFNLNGRRHEPVSSSKLRITIISQDDLAGRVSDELRSVKSQTGLVRLTQLRGKQETQQFGDDTKAKERLDSADQSAAQRLAQQQASTAASTKQLAAKVQQSLDRLEENRSTAGDIKDIATEIKQTFDKTSEGAMKDAAQDLSRTTEPATAEQRKQAVADAQSNQQKALDQLDHAMAKMENIGSLQSTLSELSSILAEQRAREENEKFSKTNLGKKVDQLAEEDKAKLQNIADRQGKLADRTEQAITKMAKQAAQMQTSDPSSADAMKAAADQGQQSKVSQTQQRASQQTSQNQQASAQQSQQQVELGLEQMVNQLKEAQKRELARLQQHLAQLQEQIATLIRRQSGHNLDNLLLQGPGKLKAIDPKTLVALTQGAQRQPEQMKAPELRLLSSAQELTDRNTRDIAKSTDQDPQSAAIGAQLTKAAGKMERAIVGLRAGKVAEAYDPDQVDALAALIEAKKQTDQQKDELDKKEQQAQQEAIRQRYIALKADQERVNAETKKVEQSRDAQGNILRTQWPTIAKLPNEQADLAAKTAKIEEDLSSLGSIVFVWANHDIKAAMDGVHDDLAGRKTGVPTQAEQERIVEQLTAMIDNLKEVPPPEKKFENGGGGGGGGQGQQATRMPTEIELRLLKSLQSAVNRSTTKIAASASKAPSALAALGNRQGELRNLLDTLLKKASRDQMKLDPEPENKDQLPEEKAADQPKSDDDDLSATLLGEAPEKKQAKVDENFKLIGTRMARSRQRLALNNDPGAVTQDIQKRILGDLDQLIDLAHKNSQEQQSSSSTGGQQQGQPKPDQAQANNQGQNKNGADAQAKSAQGAINKNSAAAGSKPHDLKDITETASEWGAVTPRVRQAVIESQGESIVEQYRKIIEDYYGALSTQGSKK